MRGMRHGDGEMIGDGGGKGARCWSQERLWMSMGYYWHADGIEGRGCVELKVTDSERTSYALPIRFL